MIIDGRKPRNAVILHIVLVLLTIPFAVPLVLLVVNSTRGAGVIDNYASVLSIALVPRFFLNSIVIAVCTVLLTYAVTMGAAYALAKLPIYGREVMFYGLVIALTLPSAALSVPLFITIRQLGLYNTPWSVILPLAALQTSFNVLLARQFLEGIPDELLEAARVDGATTWTILWRIILPLARPIAAVIIVWTFVGAWNEYLLPLIFLQDTSQQTITLLPRYLSSQFTIEQTKLFAAAVMTALPTVICYLFFQRSFEQGITAGATK